jgi:hypothetical protein
MDGLNEYSVVKVGVDWANANDDVEPKQRNR